MSALRYIGTTRVRLTYLDRMPYDGTLGGYRCVIRTADGELRILYVGEPRALKRSVDSPEAFDEAARAAVAVAFAELGDDDLAFDAKGDALQVRRSL